MTTVRYCDYYDSTRNDPAFYTWDSPEWVATVEVEDKLLEAWVVGEMRIHLENESIVRYADDLFSNSIDTDEKLFNLNSDFWQNNSWIELRNYEGEWIGDVFSGHIYHDIPEAVEAMEMLLKEPEFLAEYPCKNPDYVVGSAL
jgi:hypothetical protein